MNYFRYKQWKVLTGSHLSLTSDHHHQFDDLPNYANETINFRKLVYLYDIQKDKKEQEEISEKFPEIVNEILGKLADQYVSYNL